MMIKRLMLCVKICIFVWTSNVRDFIDTWLLANWLMGLADQLRGQGGEVGGEALTWLKTASGSKSEVCKAKWTPPWKSE